MSRRRNKATGKFKGGAAWTSAPVQESDHPRRELFDPDNEPLSAPRWKPEPPQPPPTCAVCGEITNGKTFREGRHIVQLCESWRCFYNAPRAPVDLNLSAREPPFKQQPEPNKANADGIVTNYDIFK